MLKARGPGVRRPGVTAPLDATRFAPRNPRPVDPAELAAQNVANRNYATTTAGLVAEEGQVRQSFGLDDPSNPFSKAELMKQSFERAKEQAGNSYASRGLLYSGSLQNQLDYLSDNNNQNYAGLRAQQTSLLDDIVRRRGAASDNRQNAIDTAAGDAVTRAVNTPVDPNTVPAPKKKQPGERRTVIAVRKKQKKGSR